ncbi:Wzz/FepE/Etk N-terminal domain-containing protein [Nesterenkonia pannonica]|uniref:Wzz/FepE/Etk N-terminal domain-containing protein n=1 Tax=Nesterenkonia pannonica TaxID=1548602 RepID=UPI0021640944|nr:Wzz/FepE/Etk N-terminal domain-containing protein [Nesterenkonia pannonica]
MTLKDVLGIIRQRWLTVLVTALLITGAAGVYAALTEQSYESTTILRFSSAASQSLEGGEAGYPGMDLDLDTFFVTSEEVLEQASAASGETVETLRSGTVATLMEGTRALRLAVTSEAPPRKPASRRQTRWPRPTSHTSRSR